MAKAYVELLRDPRWQRRRLEVMERDGWACRDCGRSDRMLQVHHTRYVRGKMPWEYPDSMLRTLCVLCHENVSLVVLGVDEIDGGGAEEWSVWFRAPVGMLEEGTNNGAYCWSEPNHELPNARVSRNCLPISDEQQANRDSVIAAARHSLLANLGIAEQQAWMSTR